jgi:hypothetical protein
MPTPEASTTKRVEVRDEDGVVVYIRSRPQVPIRKSFRQMEPNTSVIERAFELARSGKCRTVGEIRHHLMKEGYDLHQIEGPELIKQLRDLCGENRDQ